ncbi:histidinol-phosphate transaminase [Polyrhizophydium stewartii]|uniref:histidinol-phosphate transaminase n=1 Tax=Polyrhizophydium stewartii TaxID=2732419 RepID=A0ABR4NK41_9FUNG|nr:histidinol-phosphate transaminase [Polyrhizophydium stewartii]
MHNARPDFVLRDIVRPNILALQPYRCARDDYKSGILLDANENSYGPALSDPAGDFVTPPAASTPGVDPNPDEAPVNPDVHLERYPDPHQHEVKSRLCAFRGLPSPDHLFLGVGSDESIDIAIRVFCRPGVDKILICPPTYGMYSVSAQINDVQVVRVPLDVADGRFQLQVDQVLETLAADPLIKILFLCSPGNPTGNLLAHADVKRILDFTGYKGIVLVDEAYIDFSVDAEGVNLQSVASWTVEYPNLVVTQTLSKAFGLAGIRCGVSISSTDIARIFNSTKAPYNISTPTSLLARSALSEVGLDRMRMHVMSTLLERERLRSALPALPRVGRVFGGNHANFILVEIVDGQGAPDNKAAFSAYKQLAEVEHVVVRFRGNELGCTACLRITIGMPEHNEQLLERMRRVLSSLAA